jgi:hypothetical protein
MKNTTEGILPFQQALYQKVMAGGFKHGELLVLAAGRQTGKSTLNQYYGKLFNNNPCKEIFLPMKPAPKYKFSRSKWYEAKLPRDGQGAFNWCVKQFGPEPTNPDAWSRWYFNVERKFRFRDEKDYVFFMLRWS